MGSSEPWASQHYAHFLPKVEVVRIKLVAWSNSVFWIECGYLSQGTNILTLKLWVYCYMFFAPKYSLLDLRGIRWEGSRTWGGRQPKMQGGRYGVYGKGTKLKEVPRPLVCTENCSVSASAPGRCVSNAHQFSEACV